MIVLLFESGCNVLVSQIRSLKYLELDARFRLSAKRIPYSEVSQDKPNGRDGL